MTGPNLGRRAGVGLALALALPCHAQADVDGVYRLSESGDCSAIGEEGGAIRIQDGVLYGISSQCRMLNPVPVRNMDAELVDMMCTGQGTEWTERAIVMRGAEEELILVWNGYAFAYPRCPNTAPLVTATVRPRKRPVTELPDRRPLPRPIPQQLEADRPLPRPVPQQAEAERPLPRPIPLQAEAVPPTPRPIPEPPEATRP